MYIFVTNENEVMIITQDAKQSTNHWKFKGFVDWKIFMLFFTYLLVLTWVLTLQAQWESQTASVSLNNFGKCPWMAISSSANIETEPNKFHVVSYRPSEEEKRIYQKLPETLTKSNPQLGVGMTKGVSAAEVWAKSPKNSWQLPPEHPRNNKPNCVRVTKLTGETAVEMYEELKKEVDFYVVKAVNALIHESGIIALPCGYFQPLEGCETLFKYVGRKWWNKCHAAFQSAKTKWPTYWIANTEPSLDVFNSTACKDSFKGTTKRYSRVFVISAAWDHNYHHFLIDSLSRLVRHVDFLVANPDVRIHIREFDQYAKESQSAKGRTLRELLLQLLGLDPRRLVSGVVLADEVFMPRAVKCNYPISSAYEVRLLASILKERAAAKRKELELVDIFLSSPRKKLTIQHRACTTDLECSVWRHWNDTVADSFVGALSRQFAGHRITVDNSQDPRISQCMACQVALYSTTHVLVGLHGAGLTNMIYMPPGGLVVEIVGQFDGRMLPLCGYHGGLAAVFGLHHYIYYYDSRGGEALDPHKVAAEAAAFHRFLSK